MNFETVKGYLLTCVGGLVAGAGVVFVVLQWGVTSTFSFYGKPIENVPTIYLMLASAVGGPVFFFVCWQALRGVAILYKSRRAQAKGRQQLKQAVAEAGIDLNAARGQGQSDEADASDDNVA